MYNNLTASKFLESNYKEIDKIQSKIPYFNKYMKIGYSPVIINGYELVIAQKDCKWLFAIKNNIIYSFDCTIDDFVEELEDSTEFNITNYEILGVFTKSRELLINADILESEYTNPLLQLKLHAPVFSFTCLAQLILNVESGYSGGIEVEVPLSYVHDIAKLLVNDISIISWSADEYAKASAHEITMHHLVYVSKAIKDYTKLPVKIGYTYDLNEDKWHKPGTVLIQYNNTQYALSIDDNQYYGCELPENNNKTFEQAINSLKPLELKKSSNFQRQGEWFFAPIHNDKFNPYSSFETVSLRINNHTTNLILPTETPDSNKHELQYGEIVINIYTGQIYIRNGIIVHDEHPKVNLELIYPGIWCKVIKNRAIRSVSQDGVD